MDLNVTRALRVHAGGQGHAIASFTVTGIHSVGSAVSIFSAHFSSEHLIGRIFPFKFSGGKN